MKIELYADRDMLAINVANILAGELEKSLLAHDTVSMAVPGGTTPGPIFDMMSNADLEWHRVQVMLTDERWVPESHAQSNGRLLRERLLTDRAAAANFLPFFRESLSVADAASEVGDMIAPQMPLSVLVLGMGADMHTASLFPDSKGLDEALAANAPILCPIYLEGQDIPRITLAAHVLDGALSKHLIIYGEDKRKALEKAMTLPPHKAPIAAVMNDTTVHWAA